MSAAPAIPPGDDAAGLTFSAVLAALPDQRHRRALLDMVALIGAARRLESDRFARVRSRDAAIRAAVQRHYPKEPRTVAARKLASDLARYARTSYPDLGPTPSAHRRALRAVLDLNAGRPLAYRRILHVL